MSEVKRRFGDASNTDRISNLEGKGGKVYIHTTVVGGLYQLFQIHPQSFLRRLEA